MENQKISLPPPSPTAYEVVTPGGKYTHLSLPRIKELAHGLGML